jgi:hypothetical protein
MASASAMISFVTARISAASRSGEIAPSCRSASIRSRNR